MTEKDFKFLKQLTECAAPSGFEKEARDLIVEHIKPFVSKLRIDKLGNIICEKGNGNDFLISAHMDEVGFIVNEIYDDGYIGFAPIGGINPESLPSKRVYFPKSKCYGVVGAKPIHLNKEDKKTVSFRDLYLDIGAETKSECESMIAIGDIAVFATNTEQIQNKNKMIKGKAIDNRLGCFLLCKLLENPEFTNCTCIFTVQEENGLFGASAFVNENSFPFGIALDVTTPNDLPGALGPDKVCCIGKGPVISFADGRCIYDNDLVLKTFKLLKDNNISCQTKAVRAGGNEASAFQQEGFGMKALSVSIPCRYIHGPVGLFSLDDLYKTSQAILCIIKNFCGKENENV